MNLHLSNYDFIFASIIVISAIFAMMRGGVAELLSVSNWFLALFVMRHYAPLLENILPAMVSNQLLRSLLSYLISFVVVAVIINILKMIFHKFIQSLGLGGLNLALGALFGIVRGIIISALIILAVEIFNLDPRHSWQQAWLSPILIPTVTLIVNSIPERMKHLNQELGTETSKLLIH